MLNRGGSNAGVFDIESNEGEPIMNSESEGLESERRSFELKRRHVQMMAFGILLFCFSPDVGASLGTGILYGPGGLLYLVGPISSALGYIFMGSIQYAVLVISFRSPNL